MIHYILTVLKWAGAIYVSIAILAGLVIVISMVLGVRR